MILPYQKVSSLHDMFRHPVTIRKNAAVLHFPYSLLLKFKSIGFSPDLGYYEKRKLGVFNLLNVFQLLAGLLIPFAGLLHQDNIPVKAWAVSFLPPMTSLAVLVLNRQKRYMHALLAYFIIYPFLTGFVFLHGMDAGNSLHFIIIGIFSVFFLQDIGYMVFTVVLCMISFFILSILLKDHIYELESENKLLYLMNQSISLGFIFVGLYLVKKENYGYQFRLLAKNTTLQQKNTEIGQQKIMLAEKAELLNIQTKELTELNGLKNRLFSVISHDLKSPMYALRNLFQHMHQYDLPAHEVKDFVPEVLSDLNYTISLMENLLQWSKSQMQADHVRVQEVDLCLLIGDVTNLLRLQAHAKQVKLTSRISEPLYVHADKDMIHLVLRNLVSNAIKFTPENGLVSIGVNDLSSFAEIYVQDTGLGISTEDLKKINESHFYTTKGTASESGTGLGLMLCREFLAKNGGQMHIESELGKGSVFSFTLPLV